MGRFKNLKELVGVKFYHIGKIELDGPGGPKPERCSMKNSMYAVAIHYLCWSSKSLQILQKKMLLERNSDYIFIVRVIENNIPT